jgi:uncharacterized circularly permuted ATP-grasp superfamily protein/uncharacterized alpha-E superfamily protein
MIANSPSDQRQKWSYPPIEGHFDEMLAAGGATRPHWQGLMTHLTELGAEEIDRRWARARKAIEENGVTYTVYGEEAGDRDWQLDTLPLVISADEWKLIEQAVIQRASLLNRVLGDVYGKQELLISGLLPGAAVFIQQSFLRPMIGLPIPGGIFNHIHAFDLARAPDGQWWVVGDRTQAPSGMGYALENRSILAQTLPEPFHACNVTRLAEFFGNLNDIILSLAPAHRENPRVALLTPGPYNETYFEHAYLARFFGYALTEGRDLLVRDSRVYLKTLSGLLPVDVILRRTDDLYCDPLELREDSVLGVPGLLMAMRAGHVAVANAPGSGLAQAPTLLPFVPQLCSKLTGEDLKLPQVATWWCGQKEPMEFVIANLPNLVIKSAIAWGSMKPIFGASLNPQQLEDLVKRIRSTPRQFIAQERVRLPTTPIWQSGQIVPRHAMIRVFAAARLDGTYVVMPGGLGRVSASTDSTVVSMQAGGGSKDVWVLSEGPVSRANPLRPPGAPVKITRAGIVLPSRVADDMFWLGRYMERVDYGIRIARALIRRLANDSESSTDLLLLLGGRNSDVNLQGSAMKSYIADCLFGSPGPPSTSRSVRRDVDHLYRIAGNLRDRLFNDAWRVLAKLNEEFVRPAQIRMFFNQATDLLDRANILLAGFTGYAGEGMVHDKGWRFLDIGQRMERSLHIAELLRWGFLSAGGDTDRLEAVLEVAKSTRIYRSRYVTTLQKAPVLDLLLLDETNPQSLAYQLAQALEHVEQFPIEPNPAEVPEDRRLLLRMQTNVRLFNPEAIFLADKVDPDYQLADLLAELNVELPQLSEAITQLYFSHVRVSQQSRGGGT